MYFITEEKGLWGKEIVFTHFAQFADAITIVTKDKGICIIDKAQYETRLYNPVRAEKYILSDIYIRAELNKLGVISEEEIQNFLNNELEKKKQEELLINLKVEEEEYNEYLKLKEKFEKASK